MKKNEGCVPKKVMYNAAFMAECLRHWAGDYKFAPSDVRFDWPQFKRARDAYVHRLNGIYERNLEKDAVEFIHGEAHFLDCNRVQIVGQDLQVEAPHILIATGTIAYCRCINCVAEKI